MNQNTTSNDVDLLSAYIEKNDSQALSIFFNRQSDKFYRIAYSFLHNEADVEDVLQATFITIMQKVKNITPENLANENVIRAWCVKIVMNLCRLKLRESKNRSKRETVIGSQRMQIEENDNNESAQEIDPNISRALDCALKDLPEKYRMPIHLRYIEKMDYDEISNILMEKPGTIRVQLKRGLEKLGIILKERGVVTTGLILVSLLSGKSLQAAPSGTSDLIHKVVFESNSKSFAQEGFLSKHSLLFSKTQLMLVSIALITIASLFYIYQKENMINSVSVQSQIQNLSMPIDYTNFIWNSEIDFKKAHIYENSPLNWDGVKKGMVGKPDKIAIFGLNIKKQDRPFCIESSRVVYTEKTQAFLMHRFLWASEDLLLKYKHYQVAPYSYKYDKNTNYLVETYSFKNYLINFFEHQLVEIIEYENIPDNSKIICINRNFLLKSINSKTFDPEKIPEKVKTAVQSIQNTKTEFSSPEGNLIEILKEVTPD